LRTRCESSLEAFRVVAGALLVAHFVDHLLSTKWLIEAGGMLAWDWQATVGVEARASLFRPALSSAETTAILAVAPVLALLLAAGVLPRVWTVALFCLSVSLYRVILPASCLDDVAANLLLFWLMLLPTGRGLRDLVGSGARAAGSVPGSVVTVALSQVSVLYLAAPLWLPAPSDKWRELAIVGLIFSAAGYVAAIPWLRVLAVAAQVAAHGYLVTSDHLYVTHGALLATAILLWGEAPNAADSTGKLQPFTARFAIGVLHSALVATFAIASGAAAERTKGAVYAALDEVGLAASATGQARAAPKALLVVESAQKRDIYNFALSEGRAQLLLARLDPKLASNGHSFSHKLSMRFAQRYCTLRGVSGLVASLKLESDLGSERLVRFSCGDGSEPPRLLSAQLESS
jgi:hypothetical protein